MGRAEEPKPALGLKGYFSDLSHGTIVPVYLAATLRSKPCPKPSRSDMDTTLSSILDTVVGCTLQCVLKSEEIHRNHSRMHWLNLDLISDNDRNWTEPGGD